jgi:YD repeat-containing protein
MTNEKQFSVLNGRSRMIVNKKLLLQHNACKEGIVFFENNFPEEVDLDKVEIEGDYNGFISWLKHLPKLIFDDKGTLIKKIYRDGLVHTYEYDDNRNLIKSISVNGSVLLEMNQYEYDDKNRLLKHIASNDSKRLLEYIYEYDDKDRLVKKICGHDNIFVYEYDDKDRLIRKICPNDVIIEWTYNQENCAFKIVMYGEAVNTTKHDHNGNLIESCVRLRYSSDEDIIRYEYNDRGNKVKNITSDGDVINYDYKYDSQDRLTEVFENGKTILSIKWKD